MPVSQKQSVFERTMKFRIKRDHFSIGLQQVINVVGNRVTMPVLHNVLIRAEDNYITLTTTNLDLGICCHIKATVDQPGALTLPVRKLATIVKSLPNTDVEIESTPENQAKIASGGSLFKIMGIGHEDFPAFPTFDDQHTFVISQDVLSNMLRSVSYAQSSDENRNILNGVYFIFEDSKLTLVATDGRRLALIRGDLKVTGENAGNLILPGKTVSELERLLCHGEQVQITFNERQVLFKIAIKEATDDDKAGLKDSIYLVSKTVEGKYPDYNQVIPNETEHRIKIERELMHECVQRAALVTSEKNNSVKVKISQNLLEISGSSPEYGESHESMAIVYEGDEVEVAFNPVFLMDPLKALTKDEVFLEFKDEFSPGVFKTLESFLCVIMPLRSN